jgi:hypothetical protein
MKERESLDLLGIKPIGEAISAATKAAIDAASAFLGRICLPAAEEFGLLIRDKISFWRLKNFLKISEKAENLLKMNPDFELKHSHPRLVFSILEHGSWSEDSTVQDMWAGLLASSCTSGGEDDSNLIFINLLSHLTKSQARLLKFSCECSGKYVERPGLIMVGQFVIKLNTLFKVMEIDDINIIDRELDHLRSLGLIVGGIIPEKDDSADITPTALALYMYVRCQGSKDSPVDYFKLEQGYCTLPS